MLRIALALTLLIAASTAAAAGEFQVKNCSGGFITILGFDETDTIKMFYSSTDSLNRGATGTVKCATSSCKMDITNGILPRKEVAAFGSARCVIAANNEYAVYAMSDDIWDCGAQICN